MRLPDLLVSEGVVHAETVVEIFEAQALYGGAFDTNLLELGILDERRLVPYLERTFALQNRVDLTAAPTPEAIERLPRRTAEQHKVVPVRLIGRTLDVVCADPSDLRALDEIGFTTGCRLQVNVAIEARVAELLFRAYAVPLPGRLANVLAGKTWLKPLLSRPGRPPPTAPRAPASPAPASRPAGSRPAAPIAPAARPVAPPLPVAPPAVLSPAPRAPEESITEQVLRAEPEALAPPLPARERPRTAGDLANLLAGVSERDQIPPIVLGFLAGLHRVVLLRVRKNELAGWDATGDVRREAVLDTTLPLELPSLFATVVSDVSPYDGPLPRGPVEAAFLEQIGAGSWPVACLLAPVRVKGRVVAILYADSPDRTGMGAAHEGLITAAHLIAETLVRVILVKKQAS